MCRHPKAEWLKYHPQVSFSNWFGFSWKFKCKRWIVSQMIMESKQKWNWQQNWRHHQTKEKAVRLYFIAINMKSWLQYIHETLKEQQANHCSSSIMASGRIASVSHFCLPCLCFCPFWTWWNRNKSSMETVIRISSSFPWFQIFVKQVIYIELYIFGCHSYLCKWKDTKLLHFYIHGYQDLDLGHVATCIRGLKKKKKGRKRGLIL